MKIEITKEGYWFLGFAITGLLSLLGGNIIVFLLMLFLAINMYNIAYGKYDEKTISIKNDNKGIKK